MAISLGGTGIWNASLRFGDEKSACEAAMTAEELGYTALWIPDAGGEDLFPRLSALLGATNRIVIATGILNLWMHDVATVAARYTELTDKHGDRLLLGIGVSHAPIVERTGGGEYRRPLAKMNSFLDDLDASSAVPRDNRVLAALGPKMLQTARDRSAGAHPYLVVPEHTATARQVLGPNKLLAPEVGVVLESDPARAREIARSGLELYMGLPNYVNNWRRYGFGDEDVTPPASDRLVDALIAWGDEEQIAARIREHRDAGADHVCIQVLTGERVDSAAPLPLEPLPIEQWRRLAPVLV